MPSLMREYGNSGVSMKSPEERAATYYNAGNSLYQSNKYQEAVDAYKQSLRLNPNDEDTRYNLQMARAKLTQQQQQKQQNKDQKQDQKKDQQKQNQQQNQQQDQKQDQQQNQKRDQQQQKQDEAKQDQTRRQLQKKNQMPKQEADRILDAMRNNENDVQKKLRKREAVHMRVEKDW